MSQYGGQEIRTLTQLRSTKMLSASQQAAETKSIDPSSPCLFTVTLRNFGRVIVIRRLM